MYSQVRSEGIEPPTLWFEARCSNPLSYERRSLPLYLELYHPSKLPFLPAFEEGEQRGAIHD